jgi:hypothetical protein
MATSYLSPRDALAHLRFAGALRHRAKQAGGVNSI